MEPRQESNGSDCVQGDSDSGSREGDSDRPPPCPAPAQERSRKLPEPRDLGSPTPGDARRIYRPKMRKSRDCCSLARMIWTTFVDPGDAEVVLPEDSIPSSRDA